jgi:2-keto-3-deoxy-L-rhamnonate aldolase RhmA
VAACRYPPAGVRGFGPIRNMGHGRLEFDEYLEQAARQVMVIVQVEHVDAVEDLDALLDTPGLDGICLGRNDLSGSVGKLGRYDDPQVRGMIDTLLDKCAGRDIYLGASLGPDWESVKEWASRGMRWFGVGDDIDYVVGGARSTMAGFRAAMSELDHK